MSKVLGNVLPSTKIYRSAQLWLLLKPAIRFLDGCDINCKTIDYILMFQLAPVVLVTLSGVVTRNTDYYFLRCAWVNIFAKYLKG